MTPSNALQQLKQARFRTGDPGHGKVIEFDRDGQYIDLRAASATSGAETRTMSAPNGPGRSAKIGCSYYGNGNITVTVKDSAASSTGTIAFTAIAQWVKLISVETSAGVWAWNVDASYGVTLTTIPAASNATTLSAPTITAGLTASGTAANDFSGSTGTFLTSTGATTIAGRTTFGKSVLRPCLAAVTATGSAAAALTADKDIILLLSVTTATTYGWTLPTGVAGMSLTLINTAAYANTLIPASGGTINGLSANAGVTIAASKCYIAVCTAANTWHVMEAAKATAA